MTVWASSQQDLNQLHPADIALLYDQLKDASSQISVPHFGIFFSGDCLTPSSSLDCFKPAPTQIPPAAPNGMDLQ